MIKKPFFVVRAPRLPLDLLDKFSDKHVNNNEIIKEWLAISGVLEALYIASPSLVARLESWEADPNSNKKVTRSLLRYMIRMCSRPTPFGLFAGIHKGRIGDVTSLICGEHLNDRRMSRFDTSFLMAFKNTLVKQYQYTDTINYKFNSSHYFIGNSCHYIETYMIGSNVHYRLSAIEIDDVFMALVELANQSCKFSFLVQALSKLFPNVELGDVVAYLKELIIEGILCVDIAMPITGDSPDYALLNSIKDAGLNETADILSELLLHLKKLDTAKVTEILTYKKIVKHCEELQLKPDENNLLQADIYRSFDKCSIARLELEILKKQLDLLADLSCGDNSCELGFFIKQFNARFEGQFVQLNKVLDDETGLNVFNDSSYEESLLNGLYFNYIERKFSSFKENNQLQKIIEDVIFLPENSMKDCVVLTSKNLERLVVKKEGDRRKPYSSALIVSWFEDEANNPIFKFHSCTGPSSAVYLGRFCHLDAELKQSVVDELRKEQEHSPEVIFAEVAHIPYGRSGNIISRPHLRDFEIVFMADSSLDDMYQIHVNDLYVWVENSKVKLWSKRLNKQVIPRLSCAHNYLSSGLQIYKFLCLLQTQDGSNFNFKMPSSLLNRAFLPRIMLDSLILNEKTWRIDRTILSSIAPEREDFNTKILALFQDYNLEPWVSFISNVDNTLQLDLRNPDMFSVLLEESKNSDIVILKEVLTKKFRSKVVDINGKNYSNEIVVPVINPGAESHSNFIYNPSAHINAASIKRQFGAGSEWLSLKIYSGSTVLEQCLIEQLLPFINEHKVLFDKWFFIRYADPLSHLRLRFNGIPEVLHGQLLIKLNQKIAPMLESGQLTSIELMNYDREVERYGGPNAILLIESLFMHDSKLAVAVCYYTASLGEDIRWRAVMIYMQYLLKLFDYSIEESLHLWSNLRNGLADEFNENLILRKQLGNRYRNYELILQEDCNMIFNGALNGNGTHHIFKQLFNDWVKQVGPIVVELSSLIKLDKLNCTRDSLLASLFHMQSNRVFKTNARKQEFVLYDFLRRRYFSQSKREI